MIVSRMINHFTLAIVGLFLGLKASQGARSETWILDNLKTIGGHEPTVAGSPRIIDTAYGKAIEFDGVDDALFLEVNPLAGMDTFTIEVLFSPYADGPKEQRFFHLQEADSDNRVLFETRLIEHDQWFSDAFIQTNQTSNVIYAEDHAYDLDRWYLDVIVVDGKNFRNYVNGKLLMSKAIDFNPLNPGQTSIGVRLNKVSWFKGAIRKIRITSQALSPDEFLKWED
jgi:hypothetical protein